MEPIDKNAKLASYQCMSHNLQNLQNKNTLAQSCSYFLGNENFKMSSKHFMLYTLISVRKVYLNIQSFYLNNKKEMRPQRSLFFLPNSCLILPNSFEDDEFEDGGKEKGKMLWRPPTEICESSLLQLSEFQESHIASIVLYMGYDKNLLKST